jgi:hypothetical protein
MTAAALFDDVTVPAGISIPAKGVRRGRLLGPADAVARLASLPPAFRPVLLPLC